MVEVLLEIERHFNTSERGSSSDGLSQMLATLSEVSAGDHGKPRTERAMKQAWRRWTATGADAATPPMQELAVIVRHAVNHGWLANLKRTDCLELVARLLAELNNYPTPVKTSPEAAWGAEVHGVVERLTSFLETRIAKHAGGDLEGVVIPGAVVVQREVKVMITLLVQEVLVSLNAPRAVFTEPHETDTFLRPYEGWPEAFLSLGTELSELLKSAAKEYKSIEAASSPPTGPSRTAVKRVKLFGASPKAVNRQ